MKIKVIYLILVILFSSGCLVESQKASQIFENGKFPKALEKIANPKPSELTLYQARLDQNNNSTLKVGVIDNGVDYLHPRLKDKMVYSFDANGNLKGVGKDILGEDNFAHPSLINPELFSFGSEGLTSDGKIIKPLPNPIQKINELNNIFVKSFLENLKSSSALKNTLFVKQTDELSFNIFSIYYLIRHTVDDEYFKAYTGKYIKNLEKNDLLLSEKTKDLYKNLYLDQFRNEDATRKLFLEKTDSRTVDTATRFGEAGYLRNIFNKKWRSSLSSMFPVLNDGINSTSLSSSYGLIEGFSEFVEIAKVTVENFEKEHHFADLMIPFSEYRASYNEQIKTMNQKSREDSSLEELYKVWFSYNYPEQNYNYYASINNSFCFHLNDNDFFLLSENSPFERNAKEEFALEKGKRFIGLLEDEADIILKDSTIRSRKVNALKNKRSLSKISPLLSEIISTVGPKIFYCSQKSDLSEQFFDEKSFQNLKSYALSVQHPYVSKHSESESHGTHVSGIISTQDDNIRIFPIRVITQSNNLEAEKTRTLYSWYKSSFLDFIRNNPAALLALRDDFVDVPFELTKLTAKDDLTSLYLYVQAEFNRLIDFDFFLDNLHLDTYFINELSQAMEVVGNEKLKFVNISLGTEQAIETTNAMSEDLDSNHISVFKYFEYEFFKYYVAKIAQEKAKNTLFVIAAGNSKSWLDGKSRSALPCDLSSRKLSDAVDKYKIEGVYLPQNNMKNILCVGSLNSKSDLSQFTNIPLTDIPFVVTEGEYILSPVKTTDCSIENKLLIQKYGLPPDSYNIFNVSGDIEAQSFVKELMKKYDPSSFETLQNLKEEKYDNILNAYSNSYFDKSQKYTELFLRQYMSNNCLKRGDDKLNHLSGTSMATPFVTGYLGKWLISEAKKISVSPNSLYNHPDYSPEKIIKKIMEINPIYECAKLTGVCQIKDIKKLEDRPKKELIFIKDIK